MFNILTIDLEDYFQVYAFSNVIKFNDWGTYECRVERNTDRLLSILNGPSIRNCGTAAPPHSSTSTHGRTSASALKDNSALSTQNSKLNDSALSPQHSPKATFFVLGWIAERYPSLVRRIQKEGHEIACHGYAHRRIYTQTREEFRKDVRKSKAILEDITGSEVIGYRAPNYSITNKSRWAFEVLVEEGFKYDSSIFPIRHDFYGMPDAPRFPFVVFLNGASNFEFSMLNFELGTAPPQPSTTAAAALSDSLTHSPINSSSDVSTRQHRSTAAHYSIIEFPASTVKVFGTNFPISGGGYFRLFPYSLIKKGLKNINQMEDKPFLFYLHPWELDFEQPRVKEARLRSRFRHYVNLDKTESKLKRLLSDFQFSSIRQFLENNGNPE